jgi:capsular polysaccharide export protein
MNFLFVYSYSNLYTLINRQRGEHHTAFATFRREYSAEPVHPLYVFSIKKIYPKIKPSVLDDEEILSAFRYSSKMGFINSKVVDRIELGRMYEQFYLEVIEKEKIDCIITHNIGYGFQAIARLIAEKKGLKTLVTENGYFSPLTITLEKNGINSSSIMKNWNSQLPVTGKMKQDYQHFYDCYKIRSVPQNKAHNLLKEIKQRFIYNSSEPELYHHRWIDRLIKGYKNIVADYISRDKLHGKKYLVFFVSSIYDPQLPIPSAEYVNSLCEAVIEGFSEAREQYPKLNLIIKEHPLDSKRIILPYQTKIAHDDCVYLTSEDPEWLIEHSIGVITINSSIGIKALCQYKPLLCLGDSLYNHPELVIAIQNSNDHSEIKNGLVSLVNFNPDKKNIDNFLTNLFFSTQVIIDNSFQNQKMSNSNFYDQAVSLLQ